MIDLVFAITSFSNTKDNLLPLVVLAIAIDASIVSIWYIVGAILNNNAVKQSALSEVSQLFESTLLIVLVIFFLLTFSTMFYNILNTTSSMKTSTVNSICTNLEDNSNMTILSSSNSILSGYKNTKNSFPGLCEMVSNPTTTTEKIDYPVAASAVILANVTNQTFKNMNSLFLVEAYTGFLSKLKLTEAVCLQPTEGPLSIPCSVPFVPFEIDSFLRFSFAPFEGYSAIYSGFLTLGALINTALESFTAQLLIIISFLYLWPFLLFLGLVFRSVFLTRRLGGLFIAIAVGFIIFLPLIMSIEYLSLNHNITNGDLVTVNSITLNNVIAPIYNNNTMNTYNLNFYDEPSIEQVTGQMGCWPGNDLITKEAGILIAADDPALLGPDIAVAGGYSNGSVSTFDYWLDMHCSTQGAVNTLFASYNIYGIIGITAYWLPIVNIIIVLSGIVGLSGLLGGDVNLAGLGRLI
jgi:hypothetical protein